MKKSPGFWFFTGDWLKDPELRFCSLFARGLLVDLLCYMFEAKEQGFMTWADGSPRTDREIVDAISGGSTEEKLAALEELVKKGVLSRDSRGALYSRRLSKLKGLSEVRRKNGSKGGSKKVANRLANDKQSTKQNSGVTDTVSVTDSDSVSDTVTDKVNTPPNPQGGNRSERFDASKEPLPNSVDTPEVRGAWSDWCQDKRSRGKRITEGACKRQFKQLVQWGPEMAVIAIENAIANGWSGLFEPKESQARQPPADYHQIFLDKLEQARPSRNQ